MNRILRSIKTIEQIARIIHHTAVIPVTSEAASSTNGTPRQPIGKLKSNSTQNKIIRCAAILIGRIKRRKGAMVIEQKNNQSSKTYNTARMAHGALRLAHGAMTGNLLSAAKGAGTMLGSKAVAIGAGIVVFILLLPIIIIAAVPQVLFGWGTVDDEELLGQKNYADYLVSCYEGAEDYKSGEISGILDALKQNGKTPDIEIDQSKTDILWLIAIDSVRQKQNVMKLNAAEIQSSIRQSLSVNETKDENGKVISVSVKNKDPEIIMTELGFSEEEKNWARLMYSSMTYGQYQSSDETEIGGYQETLGDGETQVVYYNQRDSRWKNTLYGREGTIGDEGCGPTAVAIVTSTFTGRTITPVDVAKWSVDNGHRCIGHGSYHSLIPAACKYYGLSMQGLGNSSAAELAQHLSQGKLVIALMRKGHFTTSSHFIVLRGITKGNKVLVADPVSYKKSGQEWEISIILEECAKGAAAGGPFWVVEK